jgi:hypothetical protein
MNSQSEISNDQDAGLPLFRGGRGVAAFALVAVVVLGASYAFGVSERERVARDAASALDAETRAFCAGVGIAATSDAYARCADGASDLRRRHERRVLSDLADL